MSQGQIPAQERAQGTHPLVSGTYLAQTGRRKEHTRPPVPPLPRPGRGGRGGRPGTGGGPCGGGGGGEGGQAVGVGRVAGIAQQHLQPQRGERHPQRRRQRGIPVRQRSRDRPGQTDDAPAPVPAPRRRHHRPGHRGGRGRGESSRRRRGRGRRPDRPPGRRGSKGRGGCAGRGRRGDGHDRPPVHLVIRSAGRLADQPAVHRRSSVHRRRRTVLSACHLARPSVSVLARDSQARTWSRASSRPVPAPSTRPTASCRSIT